MIILPTMTTTTKILLTIIAIITICFGGFIAYQQYMFNNQTIQMQNSLIEMKQLKDDIIRSQSKLVNQAGFDAFVAANQVNLDGIQKDIKSLGGQISAINIVMANSTGQVINGKGSSTVTPIPSPVPTTPCDGKEDCVRDPNHYFSTVQSLNLSENFKDVQVPIGSVQFTASNPDNKPWGYTILPRQYKIDNTIAHTANGQTVIYNNLSIRSGDKDYTIPITSSATVEKFPESSFSFWSPRGYIGISGSVSIGNPVVKAEATPSLGVSIMSYGKTKIDPDLRVLSVGVGYGLADQKPAAEVSPIQFNVGKMISGGLLNNTYVGPTVGANTAGAVQVGIGMQVGL